MRYGWRALVAGIVAFGVLGSSAFAQTPADVMVDINLKDADMITATRTLTMRTGIQFVVEPSSEPFGRITLKLDRVTAEDAIRYITQAAGAYFRREENGVFIISRRKPEAVVAADPIKAAPKIVQKLKFLRRSGQEIYDMVIYGAAMDPVSGFAALKRFTQLSSTDTVRLFGTPTLQNAVLPSNSYGPVAQSPQPLTARQTSNDIALPGEGSDQIGGGGRGGGGGFGGGGQGGFGGGGQGGGGGLGGGGGQGGGTLQPGQGLISDLTSIDFISYDPTDNSFIVRGNADDIQKLRERVAFFDVAPAQVLVKVEFITTGAGFQNEIGYNWTYNRGALVTGFEPTLPSGPGSVFLSWASGNVATRLRQVLRENNATTVASPILRTLNNQPALINAASQITFFVNNSTVVNQTVVTTSTAVQLVSTTQLAIQPRINFGDRTVTMFLTPQISPEPEIVYDPNGNPQTNVRFQTISVVARVKDGETIVLGGFNNKSSSTQINRIPVLSDLPIVGQFFRATYKRSSNSELLIFVTPFILDDESSQGAVGP